MPLASVTQRQHLPLLLRLTDWSLWGYLVSAPPPAWVRAWAGITERPDMHINALSDIVVIRRLPPDEMSEGGIALAYDPDHKEDIGIVEFAGNGKLFGCRKCKTEHRRPLDVKKGDKVIFSTNGHQITNIAQQELVVLREPSIIGIIEQ
jgi:chaperonin GroES